MLATLSPIVTLVRPMQDSKADLPMLVTPSGIVILVRPTQRLKEPCPIAVTVFPLMVSGMISAPDASLSQPAIVTEFPLISYSKTEGRWLHPERIKASDIDNRRASLIVGIMPVASASGHYKRATRLHRPPIPVQEPRCGARGKQCRHPAACKGAASRVRCKVQQAGCGAPVRGALLQSGSHFVIV